MCGNGLDFERASGRVGEVSGVEWSVSQSIRCEKCPPTQSKAFIFLMYKKEKENKQTKKEYIYPPLYTPCTTYLTAQEIFYQQ